MPIQYALRSRRDTPLTSRENTELVELGYSPIELHYSFDDVPPVVAKSFENNGVYAVFSSKGRKLSGWVPAKPSPYIQAEHQKAIKRPGKPLLDSIKQELNRGDYALTHTYSHKELELVQVIRNTPTKTVVEPLTSDVWLGSNKPRTINPHSLLRIPSELIEDDGTTSAVEQWEKKWAIRTIVENWEPKWGMRTSQTYVETDEITATNHDKGHFGYFNSSGNLISGWIPFLSPGYLQFTVDKTKHSGKKITESVDVPITDVMGEDILLNDWVFSNDNQGHHFSLYKVIGFSKDAVRLDSFGRLTLNNPKNIVKLPFSIPD
jgi:hypothetical protein